MQHRSCRSCTARSCRRPAAGERSPWAAQRLPACWASCCPRSATACSAARRMTQIMQQVGRAGEPAAALADRLKHACGWRLSSARRPAGACGRRCHHASSAGARSQPPLHRATCVHPSQAALSGRASAAPGQMTCTCSQTAWWAGPQPLRRRISVHACARRCSTGPACCPACCGSPRRSGSWPGILARSQRRSAWSGCWPVSGNIPACAPHQGEPKQLSDGLHQHVCAAVAHLCHI